MKCDLITICWLTLFFISLLFLASNLLLAPMLRLLRSPRDSRKPVTSSQSGIFSIIVPAYNEEKSILQKIETLSIALQRVDIDYEVIIGSDGSTDRTVEIAAQRLRAMGDPRWQLAEYPNEGKCKTLNKLVGLAAGNVIISTDADIPLPAESIALVVRAFQSDNRIGCLSCIPWFEGLDIGSQKSYWSIEDQIRRAESGLGKLIVVTGMLYAYRKESFVEIPDGVMADDLWIPLNVLLQGYDSIQLDELRVPYEKTDEKTEIMRRKRVIVGGMDVVRRLLPALVAAPSLLALVLFHKINRWALPVWLTVLFVSIAGLWPWVVILYSLGAVVLFYVLGKRRVSALAFAVFSPILAFGEVMSRKDFARWEHTRTH